MSPKLRAKLTQVLLFAGLLVLFWPRLANVIAFYKEFGKPPANSELGDWLKEIKLPSDASLVTSLQSYIPIEYVKANVGQWQTEPLEKYLYQSRELPFLFIEDKSYFVSNFGSKIGQNGFNNPLQRKIHDDGLEFYSKLRTNHLFPYVRIREGTEIDATNRLNPGSVRFVAYANPYAFAKNLLEDALIQDSGNDLKTTLEALLKAPTSSKKEGLNSLSLQLIKPSTIGLVHLTTSKIDSPAFSLKLDDFEGKTEVLSFDPPATATKNVTERFLRLDPPRELKSIALMPEEGTKIDLNQIVNLRAFTALPIALNPTSFYFSIKPDSKAAPLGDIEALIDQRPSKKSELLVPTNLRIKLTLTALLPTHLESLFLVFEEAQAKENALTVTAEFEDSSRKEIDASVQHQLNPRQLVFRCDSNVKKRIKKVDVVIRNTTTEPLILKQIYARAAGEVE